MSAFIRGSFLKEAREFFEALPEIAEEAAIMAVNQVTERKALPAIRRDMEAQVNFPRGYLDSPDRLQFRQRARRGNIEAVITGRDRPTSLARFAPGQTPGNTRGKGVTVMVKRGATATMKKAFIVNLKSGNRGLATRDPGLIKRAYKPVALGRGVYLLYGPSVDQVMKAVADDNLPMIADELSREFFRQFTRLSGRK